jgi:hypothetical protein
MLNSQERRPAFDAFFASLDEDFRTVFLSEALTQWHGLIDSEDGASVIDCMENVWDWWTELRHTNPSWFGPTDVERSIMAHMLDPDREARQRAYRSPDVA